MQKKLSVKIIGSINMDLIVRVPRFPNSGETITGNSFSTANGGKGANQAVAAARLGANVSFIGCVGDDDFGKQSLLSLAAENINTGGIQTTKETNTGIAVISVNNKAQNQIIVIPGANHKITKDHLLQAFKQSPVPDAVLLQLEIPLEVVKQAVEFGKKHKSLVILNPAPAIPIPQTLLKLVDYLIPNEHEACILTGEKTPEKAGKKLIGQGAKHIIITLGEKGALLINKSIRYIQPYKVHSKDPTAAGDAFVAAFTVSLLEGKSPIDSIRLANAAGALATTKIGAQPSLPTRQEVEQFIKFA